jgi:tRNA dimethylallyltransferase
VNLIVITGPTGVGKTDLTLEIAEHYGLDIINADSRQIYAEIPIGTAAPTAEQQARVKHHFVGTRHIGDYYSASLYEQDVMKLLTESKEKQKDICIMSGGSMMYIDAVCNGIDDIPTIRDDIRILMKERLATEGLEALVEELKEMDPEHWQIVDKHNPRRVVHALEICHQTGKTYTSFRKNSMAPGSTRTLPDGTELNIIKIGITREREELYERINERVLQMMEKGLIEEARRMLPDRNENALNTVGYKEMFKYFDGEIPVEEAIRQIQSHTREYARKQLTWYKKDPTVTWFNLSDKTITTRNIIENVNNHI